MGIPTPHIEVTNKEDFIVPDMKGWSISDAKTFAHLTGIILNYNGYGYVDTQSLEPGSIASKDMLLTLELKNK